ncbi:protein associated with UVRAG as autophagy enhancer isoform X2 [Dasypus novemcinctus]|nr:protein associated with UVRAG as autophagy enhancer isoform X2 [Dasypus novemcinctus]XP_004475475.1 protein associated with UVRAG as autophagy enhancer isoform X2 [Dasypus novemcinctus]XP_004475477.1 protein associated with UVRAG as autophagy enhancer isoform X2 [Dasypus novemcinctus]XP_058132650.1 protein associated with UVRAG as autophagy enhancer isoform X2 [Dasypus novemcinctus]XP_058132651.1 protein associated with UVRAG as autophagy enhancer isoform X2 [Dasypus novemcinctus]
MCEWIRRSPGPEKMESHSASQQDSPVDPWEGISDDSGDTDGSPSLSHADHAPCQLDVRFLRPRAAWINPQSVQLQLQEWPPQVPATGNRGSPFPEDIASPSGPSRVPLGNSLTDTPSWDETADSVGSSSAGGSHKKGRDFSLASTEEQVVLPRSSPQVSLLTSSKILATSPCPEVDSAFFQPTPLPVSADEGAAPVSGRTISLNSFIPEAFALPIDIEKENAHFYVADQIISVLEKMKYNIVCQQKTESWNIEEASRLLENDDADSEETFNNNLKQESGSSTTSDSGYEGCPGLQVSPVGEIPTPYDVGKDACKSAFDEFVILELGEFNDTPENCGYSSSSSHSVKYEPDFNSAELIARELYRVFRKGWVLSEASGQLNAARSAALREECTQRDFESSVDIVQKIKLKSRIRGTEDWDPPRFQIIFNLHPPLKRDLVVAAQNFFCAGCGTPIEPKFVRRLRYCEYLGRYFCACCHSDAESCIPARILLMWDFRKYPVSNFSKRLLDGIWHQPVFNVLRVGQGLYARARELDRVREMQEQLFHIKKLLKTCRFAESALSAFEQVPKHLTDKRHVFSLDDLVRVKRGLLAGVLKALLNASLAHVAGCELCQGRGFICEFCRSASVIFPFQTASCTRCSACRACFHKQCFQPSKCPRCARLTARRRLLESSPPATT